MLWHCQGDNEDVDVVSVLGSESGLFMQHIEFLSIKVILYNHMVHLQ